MHADEIKEPQTAAEFMLHDHQPVRYAPGDSTLYHCAFTRIDPENDTYVLIMTVDLYGGRPRTIVLRQPTTFDGWDAARWQHENLPEGWYPAAIALLGGLGWTREERSTFDPHAGREFDE